jgi:hypothetical protein
MYKSIFPKSVLQFDGNNLTWVLEIIVAYDGPLKIVVVYGKPSGSEEVGRL